MMFPEDGSVRIEVLQRLAEQAMADAEFRLAASENLQEALDRYGYELTSQELALVMRFRRSLAEAGVDLDIVAGMGDDRLASVLGRLLRRTDGAGSRGPD